MRNNETQSSSRRNFLKQSSGVLAGAALANAIAVRGYAAENNTIKIALIGCGGRGTGAAANALSTEGPVELFATADVLDDRMQASLQNLTKSHGKKVAVPKERQFLGFDAYKKAIDAIGPGGVALLTTPPGFRPLHLDYALEKGVNVFMEKAFAVDGPGVRQVLKAAAVAAKKNLKVAGGLMSRHSIPLEEAVKKIHEGAIGDVITCWAYRMHGPVGYRPRTATTKELEHQIRNYHCYNWLNGSFLLDWLIHNLDVCCWVKNGWPVSAQGQGGRQVRTQPDQLFDHYGCEYTFADGTRLFAQGRHINNCWGFFGDVIHGTKGSAVLGEGIPIPKFYKGYVQTKENQTWTYEGKPKNSYQHEHDMLFDAIRNDKPYNEAERCAYAALVGILGRMACESGKEVTWEQALNSDLCFAPNLAEMSWDSTPPVMPDAKGEYPVAKPGITNALTSEPAPKSSK